MKQTCTYTIYWTLGRLPCSEETNDMGYALKKVESLRKSPSNRAICIASENPDQIGKMGVDAVVDGKTPDGEKYTWVKRRAP